MTMKDMKCGMLARSLAGHDRNTLYLICRIEGDFVYLCDGRLKKWENPKKKNCRHIQIIKQIPGELEEWRGEVLKNEEIRAILKKYEEV